MSFGVFNTVERVKRRAPGQLKPSSGDRAFELTNSLIGTLLGREQGTGPRAASRQHMRPPNEDAKL
jgi:hypothetical protein